MVDFNVDTIYWNIDVIIDATLSTYHRERNVQVTGHMLWLN